MRRAHDIPPLVKAANLARWFPPWTVAREQWFSMTRLAVSGIAVDTLLFSRIGMPLFHRYRVFDRRRYEGVIVDAHGALQHGCRGHLYIRKSLLDQGWPRRSGSRVRKSTPPVSVACSSVATGAVLAHRSEGSTIRALLDLALPRFSDLGDRSVATGPTMDCYD